MQPAAPPVGLSWWGPAGSFAKVHPPPGRAAVGSVLVVPPLGYEYVCAHRSLRVLAEELAAAGWVVVRLDPPGIGDASGCPGTPGVVEGWGGAVAAAASHMRSVVDGPVVGVGLRAGALLVGAADGGTFDAVVLWDPVESGRRLVREARALQGIGLGGQAGGGAPAADPSSTELAGIALPAAAVSTLAALRLARSSVAPTLALVRADRPDRGVGAALRGWSAATVVEVDGQAGMLDGESSTALVPHADVARIVGWVSGRAGGPSPVGPWGGSSMAVVEGPGGPVEEEVLELGPGRLVAVESRPVGARPGTPIVVCLSNSVDVHTGPARAWVDWGRAMAASGLRVLRIDTPGVGDSPTPPGAPDDRAYPPEAVPLLAGAIEGYRAGSGAPVALVGLCSGGRLALPVGRAVGAAGIVAVNVFWHVPEALLAAVNPADPYPEAIARVDARRVRPRLAALVPAAAQRAAAARGLGPASGPRLRAAIAGGTGVVLVYGPGEFGLARLRSSMGWVLDDIDADGRSALEVVDGLDHAMLRRSGREQALARAEGHLRRWLADPQRPPATPAGVRPAVPAL